MAEVNQRGNIVTRSFASSIESFTAQVRAKSNQADLIRIFADSYSVCLADRCGQVVYTYCEGDFIMVSCATLENYQAEFDACVDFYENQY